MSLKFKLSQNNVSHIHCKIELISAQLFGVCPETSTHCFTSSAAVAQTATALLAILQGATAALFSQWIHDSRPIINRFHGVVTHRLHCRH